jgi:multidrug efflux pump subunit AcrA (membrane-fusion protein)
MGSRGDDVGLTFTVKRGPLDVKVLEGGSIESLDSQQIKSEVAGYQGTKILQIVEEGYEITEEDIANEKLIVELDSSEFQKELTQAKITFKGTEASLTEGQQGYEIQINKSESDIYEAELAVKLAMLELEKYLGADVTRKVLEEVDLFQSRWEEDRILENAEENIVEEVVEAASSAEIDVEGGGDVQPEPANETAEEPSDALIEISIDELRMTHPDIPWSEYAKAEILGDGEANQLLSTNEDELLLARKELGTSLQQLEGTQRLFDKGFVNRIELENDQTSHDRNGISVKAAETRQSVFINYEFPKQSETLSSAYIQAERALERTEKQALSEIAKARGALASAEARFLIESNRIEEIKENIEKCTLVATRPGLVVYGGGGDHYWREEQIKEGATIRERQTIITIPDMASMAVKVNIHEAEIKMVKKDQTARIVVDAHRDKPMTGVVSQVAVLPDSDNRWMNPDLKVYETTIKIDGVHKWLKPGMTAKTEILVEKLNDVLYIPVQSVVPDGDEQVCFVLKNGKPDRRVVTVGPSTVEFIVIESGLDEGEVVIIRPPDGSRNDKTDGLGGESETSDEESAPQPAETPVVGQG